MNAILQTNVFFYITAVGIILFSILGGVAMYYLICILRDMRDVTKRVEKESRLIEQDLVEVRNNVRKNGFRLAHFLPLIRGIMQRSRKSK